MIIFDVLKAPKMTEKTLSLKEETNQYAFEVDPRANKIQIKDCVEKTFKVSVLNVRTMNVRGKKKRMGKYQGYIRQNVQGNWASKCLFSSFRS